MIVLVLINNTMYLIFTGNTDILSCTPPNKLPGSKIAVVSCSKTNIPVLITANFIPHTSVIGSGSINLLGVADQSPIYVEMKPEVDTLQLKLTKIDNSPYKRNNMTVVCHITGGSANS